jgi:CRP-like cAMP-binding protein
VTARELLARHPIGRELSAAQLDRLAECACRARFGEGEKIFAEGGPANAVYLIVDGRVSLEQYVPARGTLALESLGRGDLLGLSWLFPGGRWILDARAVEATETVRLAADCVHARMAEDVELRAALTAHLLQALYQRLERVRLQRLDVYRTEPAA